MTPTSPQETPPPQEAGTWTTPAECGGGVLKHSPLVPRPPPAVPVWFSCGTPAAARHPGADVRAGDRGDGRCGDAVRLPPGICFGCLVPLVHGRVRDLRTGEPGELIQTCVVRQTRSPSLSRAVVHCAVRTAEGTVKGH